VSNYPRTAHKERAPHQPVASVVLATGWWGLIVDIVSKAKVARSESEKLLDSAKNHVEQLFEEAVAS
jgi:hypothetical protein